MTAGIYKLSLCISYLSWNKNDLTPDITYLVIRHEMMEYLEQMLLERQQSCKTSSTNQCYCGAFNQNILSSFNPIALRPFHRCLCGYIMLGLPSTPSNSPSVLTGSLHPKGWILLYHYHLYALTVACLRAFHQQHRHSSLILQQMHKSKRVSGQRDEGKKHLNRLVLWGIVLQVLRKSTTIRPRFYSLASGCMRL